MVNKKPLLIVDSSYIFYLLFNCMYKVFDVSSVQTKSRKEKKKKKENYYCAVYVSFEYVYVLFILFDIVC